MRFILADIGLILLVLAAIALVAPLAQAGGW